MDQKPFRFTFRKEERLSSKKLIQQLFAGKDTRKHFHFPLKAVWLFVNPLSPYPAQVVFPISKKLYKRAHDRNSIRRLMRESYRLQKHVLYEGLSAGNSSCVIAVSFISKEKTPYEDIFNATTAIFKKITESIPQPGTDASPISATLV